MALPFPSLSPTRLTGDESFIAACSGMTVLNFWRWAASNLADNTTRGLLAEYIVTPALGVDQGVRSAWDAFDLRSPSGVKIEVKSCAYLQASAHQRLSTIRFSIRPSRAWDHSTGRYAVVLRRQADVYVFALLKHQEKDSLNPLDLTQWEFHVVPTAVIERECGRSKALGLKAVQRLSGAVGFHQLGEAVERAAGEHRTFEVQL